MLGRMCRVGLSLLVLVSAVRAEAAKPAPKTRKVPPAAIRTVKVAEGIIACQYGHFWVVTDLPVEEAHDLVQRLETMLGLISKYWGKNPGGVVIPCVVFKDVKAWPQEILGQLHADGVASADAGGGVTRSQTLSLGGVTISATSVVYANAGRGTPQHEAVHAYSNLAFATTGPTWYSEGMAELGGYWREGETSINVEPQIIEYLKQPDARQTLQKVLEPFQATGDSWQNYAWRWLLCHMMLTNPNYSAPFHRLGMKFLDKGRIAMPELQREQLWAKDFEEVFGGATRELAFEFDFLIDRLDNGLRTDLIAWDWKTRALPLQPTGAPKRSTIKAARGYQGTGLTAKEGTVYQYATTGTWKLGDDAAPLSAKGDSEGLGRLEGILLKDYKLGEPFELGEAGEFTAPGDGNLYVRCKEAWIEIGDNVGAIKLEIRAKR